MKNIIYPTDFSDTAKIALPYALELARKTGAAVHIIHAIEEPYDFAPMVQDVKKEVNRKVEVLLRDMVEDIRKEQKYQEVDIQTHIKTGRSRYAIMDEARNLPADLIVMGTKGRTGLEKIFLGSTAAELIQHTSTPVWAIPEEASYADIEQIFFATDYNEGDLEALQYVAGLAQLIEAKITVFHTSKERDLHSEALFRGFRELVNEKIAEANISFEQVQSDDFLKSINDRLNSTSNAMVAMVRYDQPLSILGKKYSKEMGYSIQRPLLIIPGDKESLQKIAKTTFQMGKGEQLMQKD
jgi:nucleotide-binding universal stress UspA family protein